MPAGHAPFAPWNRSGNRVIVFLLRSRQHPLVNRRLTLITAIGRRTCRQQTARDRHTHESTIATK